MLWCEDDNAEGTEAIEYQRVDSLQPYPPGTFHEVFGATYTPVCWGKHRAAHPDTLREAMRIAAEKAPELGDVIAALVFWREVDRNRENFLRQTITEEDLIEAGMDAADEFINR